MNRKWINRLATTSLALCVMTAALWARGYWRHTDVTWFSGGRVAGVAVRSGSLVLEWGRSTLVPAGGKNWVFQNEPPDPLHPQVRNRGFIHVVDKRSGANWTLVYIPLWLVFVGLGLLPAYRAIVIQRTRFRLARRRCASCSYDLTGNTSGICPECGTPVVATAVPA